MKNKQEKKRIGRPPRRDERTVFGEYLIQKGFVYEKVAVALELSRVYVSSLASGLKYPSADVMYQIEKWSEGAVTMQSWYE